ncbi:MAG: lamin tail domain-containing protein [bacterium]|nr:lamin tail domain-containing protein [bacterium]
MQKNFAISACFCLASCFVPLVVHAEFEITEIMYDVPGTDTGREWIEVHNKGTTAQDLTVWKFFEASVAHKITATSELAVPSGGYAIIADNTSKFLIDNPGYTGLLFDSAFSLSSAETIVMRSPEGNDVDTVSYSSEWGAQGDGLSLQKTDDGRWIAATPTLGGPTIASESQLPEVENLPDSGVGNVASSSVSGVSAHDNQSVANRSTDVVELEVTSGRDRLGFTNSPLLFEAKIKKSKGSTSPVEHRWSFGDGSHAQGTMTSHPYTFPGDYIVILNSRLLGASAVSKVLVKIVDPNISIGTVEKGRVELINPNANEVNVGGMTLAYGSKKFFIASDTILPPLSSITVAFAGVVPGTSDHPVFLIDAGGKILSQAMPHFIDPYILLPHGMDFDSVKTAFIKALDNR